MLLLLRDELGLLDLRGILLGFGVVVWWWVRKVDVCVEEKLFCVFAVVVAVLL